MTALRFPSGERVDVSALPSVSSGRTTLADGSDGALLQPGLTKPLPPPLAGLLRMSDARLLLLADELGALVALEQALDEPWVRWAAQVERQAIGELARRAL